MGIVRAYFDASSRDKVVVLAGALFTPDKALVVEAEWKRIFDEFGGCHWTEFMTRLGKFKKLRDDDPDLDRIGLARRDDMMRDALRVLDQNVDHIHIAACRPHRLLVDTPISAYQFCTSFAARAIPGWLRSMGRHEQIAYVFEWGDPGRGEMERFFDYVIKDPAINNQLRVHSATSIEKKKCAMLATADCLGWIGRSLMTRAGVDADLRFATQHIDLRAPRTNVHALDDGEGLLAREHGIFLSGIGYMGKEVWRRLTSAVAEDKLRAKRAKRRRGGKRK